MNIKKNVIKLNYSLTKYEHITYYLRRIQIIAEKKLAMNNNTREQKKTNFSFRKENYAEIIKK